MEPPINNNENQPSLKIDTVERKLRGAVSMLSMLYGAGREAFCTLSDDYQDGFLDTIVDLTEDARRANDAQSERTDSQQSQKQ